MSNGWVEKKIFFAKSENENSRSCTTTSKYIYFWMLLSVLLASRFLLDFVRARKSWRREEKKNSFCEVLSYKRTHTHFRTHTEPGNSALKKAILFRSGGFFLPSSRPQRFFFCTRFIRASSSVEKSDFLFPVRRVCMRGIWKNFREMRSLHI